MQSIIFSQERNSVHFIKAIINNNKKVRSFALPILILKITINKLKLQIKRLTCLRNMKRNLLLLLQTLEKKDLEKASGTINSLIFLMFKEHNIQK